MKNTGKTDTASLTNHKPEPQVKRHPSEFTHNTPVLCPYLVGCLSSSHAIRTQRDTNWLKPA
uniref:Uncharacterized protein n=1 Tax=Mesocestoides corti TaxID=53468 RepID=A0A5K3G1J3_MESCO